jgi:hypothetical protein
MLSVLNDKASFLLVKEPCPLLVWMLLVVGKASKYSYIDLVYPSSVTQAYSRLH